MIMKCLESFAIPPLFSCAILNFSVCKILVIFRLQGEPVNLREQQDAVEFFMSLVESLDEESARRLVFRSKDLQGLPPPLLEGGALQCDLC
jgi:hypothetical protein